MQTASPLVRYIPLADAAEIIGVTRGRVMELIRERKLRWHWEDDHQYIVAEPDAQAYARQMAPRRERVEARCRCMRSRLALHQLSAA
jgi:hypothetical protein